MITVLSTFPLHPLNCFYDTFTWIHITMFTFNTYRIESCAFTLVHMFVKVVYIYFLSITFSHIFSLNIPQSYSLLKVDFFYLRYYNSNVIFCKFLLIVTSWLIVYNHTVSYMLEMWSQCSQKNIFRNIWFVHLWLSQYHVLI